MVSINLRIDCIQNLRFMKKNLLFVFIFFSSFTCLLAQEWVVVPGRIKTPWADSVNPAAPHPEYPRPQMVRDRWMNLNGLWSYSILPKTTEQPPSNFQGRILVPFAVESSLSGVGKTVGRDSVLWYERSFSVPKNLDRRGNRLLLHFGAVDWQCDVYVNGKKIGSHQGGYDPFSFDITDAVTKRGTQKINVRVWDPSDDGPQPRGKQVKKPESIWYTPVTGIWQTVWVESVNPAHIASFRATPDIDRGTLSLKFEIPSRQPGAGVLVEVWDGAAKVAEGSTSGAGDSVTISISNAKLWSPDAPFLYTLKLRLVQKSAILDEISSYFAMRKISMAPGADGIQRMMLNNKFLFQFGPLDQGWWPDGLYTAPTDGALRFDIEKTKEMGFNMIRKHVKVEPARWYYHADQLGMLVWQDMPSGDLGNRWDSRPGIYGRATDKNRTPESEQIYRTEWAEIMKDFYHFPSIVVWVPFNEAWGQFKTADITNWTMQNDPSRLVNSASGGNFEPVGHIIDMHNYPDPVMPHPDLFGAKQILVLGEFGGLGLPVEGHTWQDKNNWGYQSFKTREELYKRYSDMITRLEHLIEKGLSAAVYTQTTDVEIETNGLMTYDRKVVKMPEDSLRTIHSRLYQKL
jgi:beta-galactosidase/beta-glucuronidase